MISKILSHIVLSGLLICAGQLLASTTSELRNQALQFHHAGQLKQALQIDQLFQLEFATLRKQPLMEESYTDLAKVAIDIGQFEQAKYFLNKALLAVSDQQERYSKSLSRINHVLGETWYRQGRYQQAQKFFKKALRARQELFGEYHPLIAETMNSLAGVYFSQRLYGQALTLLHQSVGFSQSMPKQYYPSLAESYHMLAKISKTLGRDNKALDYADKATKLYRNHITSNTGRPLLKRAFSEHQSIHYLFERHLRALIELKKNHNQPDDENSYHKDLFEVMKLAHISIAGHALLARQHQQKSRAKKDVDDPFTLEVTRQYLAPDEALLFYFVGWNESYVFLVSQEHIEFKQLDINLQNIQRWLQPLLVPLQNYDGGDGGLEVFDLKSAFQLYQKLVQPIAKDMRAIKQLVIVKDPVFDQLPFQLLISKQSTVEIKNDSDFSKYRDVDWLINDFAIFELPNVQSVSILRSKNKHGKQPKKRFLAFGAPVINKQPHYNITQSTHQNNESFIPQPETNYNVDQSKPHNAQSVVLPKPSIDVEALESLPPLKHSKTELLEMAKSLEVGSETVMLRKQATETKLKRMLLDDYQILAFATHGFTPSQTASYNGPTEASLLLTLPHHSTEEDNGLLTASEIAQLKLNADLVILSACNTGVHETNSLNSLSRAFFLAGSRSLLVSYWSVESEAASLLTPVFLQLISSQPEISRAEALRQSMLKILQSSYSGNYAHPYIWAPFTIIGEGGKLSISQFGH